MIECYANEVTLSRRTVISIFMLSIMVLILNLSGCNSMNSATDSLDARTVSLTKDQIATLIASPDRSAADRTNDLRRKPDQMLAFTGLRPGMIALDLSTGGGYTTELLARAVGPTGTRRSGRRRPARSALLRRAPAAPFLRTTTTWMKASAGWLSRRSTSMCSGSHPRT